MGNQYSEKPACQGCGIRCKNKTQGYCQCCWSIPSQRGDDQCENVKEHGVRCENDKWQNRHGGYLSAYCKSCYYRTGCVHPELHNY